MSIVATLLPNERFLQRVVEAIRGQHEVVRCSTWAELVVACENRAVNLVVLDLFSDGRANFDPARQLKLRFDRITLVAYVAFTASRARELARACSHRPSSLSGSQTTCVTAAATSA